MIYEKKFRFKQKFEFYNEITIYKSLDPYPQFPKLLSYDEQQLTINFQHCGPTLGSQTKEIQNKKETIVDQFKVIDNILKNQKIIYVDLHLYNLLWNDNRLYLIDFGTCCHGVINMPKKDNTIDKKNMVRKYRFEMAQYHLYYTRPPDLVDKFIELIDQYLDNAPIC
jgi:serine/threonine-protein kinase RIO1